MQSYYRSLLIDFCRANYVWLHVYRCIRHAFEFDINEKHALPVCYFFTQWRPLSKSHGATTAPNWSLLPMPTTYTYVQRDNYSCAFPLSAHPVFLTPWPMRLHPFYLDPLAATSFTSDQTIQSSWSALFFLYKWKKVYSGFGRKTQTTRPLFGH